MATLLIAFGIAAVAAIILCRRGRSRKNDNPVTTAGGSRTSVEKPQDKSRNHQDLMR